MAECLRCGCHMKDDTANQRLQRGRDLWGCQECQAGQQFKVKTAYGICVPHTGELDEHDRPLDKKGNLFREGKRLCGYSDCVNLEHLEGVEIPTIIVSIVPEGFKRCTQCEQIKTHDWFGLDSKKRDGLNVECKPCRVARDKARNDGKRLIASS